MTTSVESRIAVDLSRSAVARYIQLASLFRRRIASGQWPLGQRIPTVEELAAQCGVARATIRQALDILESERLIDRYRAKGTFVVRRPQPQLWCEVATDWSGLLMSREDAIIELHGDERGKQPAQVPHPIGTLAPSYRHLRRRHLRQGSPFLLADLYIDERLSSRIPKKALTSKTALRLIADIPGLAIKDARQTLTIGTADVETAQQLDLPLNAPVAFVHRSVVDQSGCLVFIGEGIYRGDVVRIDIKLR
jgi:GntR family transcriptional regulator